MTDSLAPASHAPDTGLSNGARDTGLNAEEGVAGLHDALTHVTDELARGESPLDFTQQGAAALIKSNTRITKDLALEAIRLARSERLDSVSKAHVERATAGLLRPKSSSRSLVALSFGGVITGAGLQEFINFSFADAITPKFRIIAMVICLVLGSGLMVYGVTPNRNR